MTCVQLYACFDLSHEERVPITSGLLVRVRIRPVQAAIPTGPANIFLFI